MKEIRMRVRWMSVAALVGLAVTGCAGPSAPLDVGTQTAPLSLVLGHIKAVDQAPVGPISGPPIPSSRPYYQPPVLGVPLPTLPPTPTAPCPDYDPLSPVLGVGRTISAPPMKAIYRYRTQLFESIAGKPASFIGDALWEVAPQKPDTTTGAYDVVYTMKLGKNTTTRVLRTLPRDIQGAEGEEPSDQSNPNAVTAQANTLLAGTGVPPLPSNLPNMAGYGLAGIYLVSQESNGVAFKPSVPIALLQLRQLTGATDKSAQVASSITSVGVDPVSQSVMAFRSTVTGPANKINACGTKLESVQVTLSSPNTPDAAVPPAAAGYGPDLGAAFYAERAGSDGGGSPKANVLLFGEKLDFGLQFGGLLLQDAASVGIGIVPSGIQIDPASPPTATPSGSPPDADPADPTGTAVDTAMWSGLPQWALSQSIFKMSSATINEKPKLPKAP